MPSPHLASVILAAGKSARMRSKTNKVLLPILGKPMIRYQVEALRGAGIERIFVVVGFQAERVKAELGTEVEYVLQAEPKGTAHALIQARDRLLSLGQDLDVVVTVGDNPYITAEVLEDLIKVHSRGGTSATIVTAVLDPPPPYGRVIRDARGRVLEVVEEFDATPEERLIKEVHVSIYGLQASVVLPLLDEVRNANAKREFYLTDIIGILTAHGHRVETVASRDPRLTLGINTPDELAEAEKYFAGRQLSPFPRS
jgi:bifunctional UDP-N-acetylglucosamine pyrophosphorylase/glucosamine-1-phosphate N-acetyltransferase